jgi:hypothetical protein
MYVCFLPHVGRSLVGLHVHIPWAAVVEQAPRSSHVHVSVLHGWCRRVNDRVAEGCPNATLLKHGEGTMAFSKLASG